VARDTSGLKRGGPGRPKGTPNKATVEAKLACSELVDDPAYRAKLRKRLLAGKLPPLLESMLWYYAKGKPKETVDMTGAVALAGLTDAELQARIRELAGRLTDDAD
jgi:hypothetical protein